MSELRELSNYFFLEEKYRLTDQLIQASRSVTANIAEGYGSCTFKEQVHFCIQAWAALLELYNHLVGAFHCCYITQEQLNEYKLLIDEMERLLNDYISF